MDKLKMHSPDLSQENIAKLRDLFPGCVTETRNETTGHVRLQVDFDQLRQELSDHVVDGPQERYRLEWPGKREALALVNAPIARTLRPSRGESVNFDDTKNLFIEGDNLDALKLLQENYLGGIKMIYIDPPYNTGNDFIYEDNFSQTSIEYLEKSNQHDSYGNRLVANTSVNGRFHSDWLTLMYPRLRIARNLLSEDGAIFINIDDSELGNLKKICDEIFGESNFIANVAWKHTQQSKNDERYFARVYNSLLIYRKSDALLKFRFPRTEEDNKNYSNQDNDPKGRWRAGDVRSPNYRKTLCFDIVTPSGKKIPPPENGWRWSEETVREKIKSGEIVFNSDETKIVRKIYLQNQEGRTPENLWDGDAAGTSRQANAELKELFDGTATFDTPKPTALIKRIAQLFYNEDNYIALDFFAGSGTTAAALMQLNAEDGGSRKAIVVQIPEPCGEGSDALKAGYKTIADIAKERIRRAGKKIIEGKCHEGWNRDVGFRVLKVDTSNMQDVYYRPDQIGQKDLLHAVDNIKPGRSAEDLLFQVLVDWGVDLTLPIRHETVRGKTVFFVDKNALIACFESGVTEELVKELAGREPLRVVFRDNGFVSDAVKINVDQIFRQLSPGTDVKAI
ncbi:site-specific DNA-methyltransferase [Novosphingobium pituita]|uniref:site-specific DNA-methyltransferase (adenine-specific) n=1 Tax=Novosphingobium pituita TaxID=3056842 RepID=A0ABQ6PAZ9_9SPHN|nr:site-specific DNA-methyltransferase [Novosphingobium sp. IK01]GMM62432.1 site-specific DNA-methyltransferase [Novosphingobium sp. IK01]